MPLFMMGVNECLIRAVFARRCWSLLNREHLSRSDQVPDDTVNPLGPCNDLSILIIQNLIQHISNPMSSEVFIKTK
jgi:hypothetical protein